MGAILLFENQISRIHEELLPVAKLGFAKFAMVEEFLNSKGILSLDDVDTSIVVEFSQMIFAQADMSEATKKTYASALETAVRVHLSASAEIEDMDALNLPKDKRNKLTFFLLINRIHSFDEITAELRLQFEQYLVDTHFAKVTEYVKLIDIAKMSAIEKNQNSLRPKVLKYEDKLLYLAYHPDYQIAKQFFYTQIKDPLFFDFSVQASSLIKHQVFNYLKHLLEGNNNCPNHQLLQVYITPLWNLYNYCVENEISDISKLMKKEIAALNEYVSSHSTNTSGTISTNLRKYTFLTSPSIDWDATVWYLERIKFDETRMNPSRPFEAFYFDDIECQENLNALKQFIKYQLGLSTRLSIQSIYSAYSGTKKFLYHCDERGIALSNLTKADLESYIASLYTKGIKAQSANRSLEQLARFISYLEIKELINPLGFHFECYKATEISTHHDLSVSKENQEKVFEVLDKFPEVIRLLYLNLWDSGLRVNEVCALKGNAYLFDGTNAWLLVYQNKAKREKRIPISIELYHIMKDYIARNHIKSEEYIFPAVNSKGCYRATTFVKQVNALLDKYGISETYHFRSHGYRHTVATELYLDKANIQCIREYLGHASENMTRQYIDHLPNMIDDHNDDYFNSNALSWK